MKAVAGKQVLTIEGLGQGEKLHAIQEAFLKHVAFQCGYCTPGMILSAYALLLKTPRPTREQIVQAMDDNLCRCGAHVRIVDAIQEAAGAAGALVVALILRRPHREATAGGGMVATLRVPSGNIARPNIPDRRFGIAGRSIFTI